MSHAKKSWNLVNSIKDLNLKDYELQKERIFQDLKDQCNGNTKMFALTLGYAVHYFSVDPDDKYPEHNADIMVSRVLSSVDAKPSHDSMSLAEASDNMNAKHIRKALEPFIDGIDKGDNDAIGSFLYAVYYSKNNQTQSAILRQFETFKKDKDKGLDMPH